MTGTIQVIGQTFDFIFSQESSYRLRFVDQHNLEVTVLADPGYPAGTINHFTIEMTELRPDIYMVTWIEPATGNTVTHVEDYQAGVVYTNITDLASKGFWRLKGAIQAAS